jgi:hypothetical protein
MSGMQKKELYDDQEQADDAGQAFVQQVLQILSEAHDAQRNQIAAG